MDRSAAAPPATSLLDHDGLALAELVRTGETSPSELVREAIARIERVNPALNAVVHRMYDAALAQAERPLADGPFRGVPILLKDLLAWYQGEPITSGSRLYQGWIAPRDSEVVRRYRASGAIVVGKTNTPEFGLTPFTEPELFGPTRNPWNPQRTPGGSSGGSAAAVASRMVPLAGAGDGGGSIRIPASCNGVFGLKPTRGRVPYGPVRGEVWQGAVAEHCVTISVRDSAAMLDVLQGPDPGAPYYPPPPARPFLREVGTPPGRLRVAVCAGPLLGHAIHPDCRAAVDDAARLLESLGHDLVEATPPIERVSFNRAFLTVVCGELRAELDEAAALVGHAVRRTDVEVATWGLAMIGRALSAADFAGATHTLRLAARRVGEFFEEYDVLLTPTLCAPPVPIGSLQPPPHELALLRALGRVRGGRVLRWMGALERAAGKVFDWIGPAPLFNVTGQPAMSVPLHWNAEGLPVGVQVVGQYGDEATLFRLAAQLEEARPWVMRRPPISA